MVSPSHILEVKCPWSARDVTPYEAAKKKDFFLYIDDVTGSLKLKTNHSYYDQVQGNLHIVGASVCDLLTWTPHGMAIVPVVKNPNWGVNLTRLEEFYKNVFVNHIVNKQS